MNFTYRDYEDIFEYLKSKAVEISDGKWTDFTDGDFGTVMIHLMSYWGDLLSNQLDITASELFMMTANERTSLMEIVKLVGYEPHHYLSSIAQLTIDYDKNSDTPFSDYIVPSFTQFQTTGNDLSFYNLNPFNLSEASTTIIPVYEGKKVVKSYTYDNIDEYGRIYIDDYYTGTNTVQVRILNGIVTGKLSRVSDVRFVDDDLCFSVHVSLDGMPYIQFPVFWKNLITDPTNIEVIYLQTNGTEGRIGANQITKSNDINLKPYIINNPEASIGGYDPETVSEIKVKASVFARTMYTCVTLQDFEDMAMFVDDIAQVRALDYNNKEEEFPPTIPAYKQPTPPNGVPNDAYKVLIMAVPTNTAEQTIFNEQPDGGPANYGDLTLAAKQLHELYWDRKSATLYMEYRDPIYIDPWLILNMYMDEENLKSINAAPLVVDYLKLAYGRNIIKIGESIYGSVVGKDILNAFPYINYVEVRDPEYNIEAKPYEYIDMYNGYFMIFLNDELKYVPRGLTLTKLKEGDTIRLYTPDEDSNMVVKEYDWCPEDIYDNDNEYFPNSYKYIWNKKEGSYPRPDLEKLGVLYDNDKILSLMVPEDMLEIPATQIFTLKEGEALHIYSKKYVVSDLIEYSSVAGYGIPSYVTAVYADSVNMTGDMDCEFTTAYTGVKVKEYEININQKVIITQPNGSVFEWTNTDYTEPVCDIAQVYCLNSSVYVPVNWDVKIEDVEVQDESN